MKKNIFIFVSVVFGIAVGEPKPIEYHIQENYNRMMLVLRGDIQWQINRSGDKMEMILHGDENKFVAKNMRYNFRDGVIKEFIIQPIGNGERKISIRLRAVVDDYKVYQQKDTKQLYIEFYPGKNYVRKTIQENPAVKEQQDDIIRNTKALINIPQVALDQIEPEKIPEEKRSEEKLIVENKQEKRDPGIESHSNAALWLILLTVSILIGGITFAVIAVAKRTNRGRTNSPKDFQSGLFRQMEKNTSDDSVVITAKRNNPVLVDESEEDFAHSVEFAEQYLRSQGEFDLQMRLEKMTASSSQKKATVISKSGKKRSGTMNLVTAEKLGLSVGELELVSRLQQYHKKNSMEAV